MGKQEIFAGLAIALIIGVNVYNLVRLAELDNKLPYLEGLSHDISNVGWSVTELSEDMNEMREQFVQEQAWVQENGYEIQNIDTVENTVDLLFEWRFRELADNEEVAFLYRLGSGEEWTELDAVHMNGLNYSLEHRFPLDSNISTQVIARSESESRSDALFELDFYDQLSSRVFLNPNILPVNQEEFEVHIDITNNTDEEFVMAGNVEDMRITEASAFLYYQGELLHEWDILEGAHNSYTSEYSEEYFFYTLVEHEEASTDLENVELRVLVEDELGMEFETVERGGY
jgi:hypothetical protein